MDILTVFAWFFLVLNIMAIVLVIFQRIAVKDAINSLNILISDINGIRYAHKKTNDILSVVGWFDMGISKAVYNSANLVFGTSEKEQNMEIERRRDQFEFDRKLLVIYEKAQIFAMTTFVCIIIAIVNIKKNGI